MEVEDAGRECEGGGDVERWGTNRGRDGGIDGDKQATMSHLS